MAIKKMSLSWITVSDMSKAKKFFSETLGLPIMSDSAEYGWLEVAGKEGGMHLGIAQAQSSDDKPGSNAVVTLTVDNIVASKKELEAKGVRFIDDIMEVPGHVKLVTFVDGDGNKFQLVEELS